ncbi:unnamed protein product [Cylindrotheca closterium]|uniref:Uncharacterized protein n=1 Tax=Cylindrotheca closterium TaxID=2856 RepID=A0AAD2FIJ3_9STRA|nr:unnamed protein product [Cylindrotheca closterium]
MRAQKQQQKQISNSLSKRRGKGPKTAGEKCCLFLIMITPIILVLSFIYVAGIYKEMTLDSSEPVTAGQLGHVIADKLEHRLEQQKKRLGGPTGGEEKQLHINEVKRGDDDEEANSNVKEFSDMQTARTSEDQKDETNEEEDNNKKEVLVLATSIGDIRITLRSDLSKGSVDYLIKLAEEGCERCKLYRAEPRGILQGIMANKAIKTNTEKGSCPPDVQDVAVGDCPSWDKNCGCHGPIMTRGSVGWAAGQAGGPDFFIDNYKQPAKFWGTQHTNFGKIEDDASFAVIEHIFDLPTKKQGLTFLVDEIHFQLRLE